MTTGDVISCNHQCSNIIPFPLRCENEADGIRTMTECFQARYGGCPVFYEGSLARACEEAFESRIIENRRPVLVYLHNDESLVTRSFCEHTFCSEKMISYLLDNYIVWPWDITLSWNRRRLVEIWEEMFLDDFSDDFFIEEGSLMIGIMRDFPYQTNGLTKYAYDFTTLLKSDTLIGKSKSCMYESALKELNLFKKQWDKREYNLSFDIVQITGLCPEIVLEISKYLSLNDIVSAFSINIILLLNNYFKQFHLSNPDESFIKRILQTINPEQIVSLQLNRNRVWSEMELTDLSIFKRIMSLTLLNLPYHDRFNHYNNYFPNLTSLSLYYDTELNLYEFSTTFNQFWSSIKRLRIRCANVSFYNPRIIYSGRSYQKNYYLKYFQLDIGQLPLSSMSNISEGNQSHHLGSICSFIKKMPSIYRVDFIINKYDIRLFLDVKRWKDLVRQHLVLNKIQLQISDCILQKYEWIPKIDEIQAALRKRRSNINFAVRIL